MRDTAAGRPSLQVSILIGFALSLAGTPALAGGGVPLTPNGPVYTKNPAYTWQAGTNVSYYMIAVDTAAGQPYFRKGGYTPGGVCSGGTCAATPPNQLTLGNYVWYVMTTFKDGSESWSAGKAFSASGPPAPVTSQPQGTVLTPYPTFTWQTSTSATEYLLAIDTNPAYPGVGGPWLRQWLPASSVCSGSACSKTLTTAIPVGPYKWYIAGKNAVGEGPWSTGKTITVQVPAPTQVSPNAPTPDATPTYTWTAAPGVTEYHLEVDSTPAGGGGGPVVLTWYQASAVCSGSTCAATPSGALPAGLYAWFLLPKNASGEGTWSSAMSFQVQTLPAPQQVGPSGLSATNQPTYRWVPVAGATGYSLWVDDATPAPIIRQSYSTSVCTATECAVTPNVTLGPGGHTWYVLTQSEAGDGPLSPGMSFVTPSWSGGTNCEGAFRAADFNADGRTDRLCSQFGVTTVQLSTGEGFASPAAWLDGEFAHQLGYPVVGDFNGDGAADVAAYDGTSKVFQVALSTGTQFLPLTAWGTASASWSGQTYSCGGTGSARPGTGNFDANGYADIHCRDGSAKILVGKSTGASFTFSVFADFSCGGAYERAGPADLDGDGRDDWYCIDGYGGLFARLSNGSAFEDGTFQGLTGVCEKDDWSLADINGDARTDVACRPNGFVGLSTGAAILDTQSTGPWCNDEKTFPSGQILRSQMQPMDVNGDGRPELVCTYAGQFVRDVHYRKWNGETLGPVQTLVEQWCLGSIQGGDFDGDGKFELVCDNGWAIGSGTPNVVPDLMIEATNGIGGKTTASYAPSSTFGCNKPPVRQVLTSLTGHDGRGATSTTSYTYCGGRSEPAEGAFLGYQQVRATAPCLAGESACPYTETEYSQELRTLGRPTLVRRSNGAGQALQQTQTFFHPQTGPSLPRQALVKEVRTTDFALSGGDSKTTSVTYLYDTHGNVTQQLSHGLVTATGEEIPNDELQTDITYWEADAERYLVSLPHTTGQREQRGQGLTLMKSVETTYDAVGDLRSVKTSVLPGTTVLERTMEYTSSGNLWRVTSELGALTTLTYDGDDLHPGTVTNPDGSVTTTWHDACGLPETVTNPNGILTTEYDEMCRPTRTEGPYDPSAPPTAEKPFSERLYLDLGDPTQQRVRVEGPSSSGGGNDYSEDLFDGLGRTYRSVRRGQGQEIASQRSYNARGSLASATAPFYGTTPADTTVYAYDPFDRLTQVTNPDGTTVAKSYGLWTETTTDPAGKATTVQRTTTTAVESTTIDGEAATTTQTFDLLGRHLRLQDHRQNAWTWSYDSLDRVLSQYDPDAGARTTTYNDALRQQTEVAPVNQSVTLTFDSLGRLTQKTSGVGTSTFQYGETRAGCSNWGRLTTVTSPGATTLTIDYDPAGQVLHQVRTIGSTPYTVLREYDLAGRMTGQMYPDGYVLGRIGGFGTPLGYDDAGRLTSIASILTTVTYDAAGRPLTQTNANGTVTTRTYLPERGVLDTLVTTGPGGTVQSLDYGYDPDLPLVTSIQSPTPGEGWTYGYDDAYRLTSSTNHTNPADNQTFDYDSLGRMTYNSRLGIYTYPPDGQPRPHAPQSVGGASYSYHANGNLNTGGGRAPTWDAENRIAALGSTITFSYDAFGERLSKSSPSGTSSYPFGDDYEATGTTTTAYISVEGLGVIAKHVTTSGVPTLFWTHTDRLGSIQAVTDASGAVIYRQTYRPYGETLGTTGTHTESRGWIDQRNDSETGLTYLHARYFDPKLGLFLSPDPTDPIRPGVGLNRYVYGLGDPVNGTDRSGLERICYTRRLTPQVCFEGTCHSQPPVFDTICFEAPASLPPPNWGGTPGAGEGEPGGGRGGGRGGGKGEGEGGGGVTCSADGCGGETEQPKEGETCGAVTYVGGTGTVVLPSLAVGGGLTGGVYLNWTRSSAGLFATVSGGGGAPQAGYGAIMGHNNGSFDGSNLTIHSGGLVSFHGNYSPATGGFTGGGLQFGGANFPRALAPLPRPYIVTNETYTSDQLFDWAGDRLREAIRPLWQQAVYSCAGKGAR